MATYRSRNLFSVPIAPEQIGTLPIAWTPLGRRGYRPDDVDALLRQLAREAVDRSRRLDQLQAENDRLKQALRTWQTNQAKVRNRSAW